MMVRAVPVWSLICLVCSTLPCAARAQEDAAPAEDAAAPAEPVEAGEIVKVPRKKKRRPVESVEDAAAPSVTVKADESAGAQASGARRIQVFLVPVGDLAALLSGPAQLALEDEVNKIPGFKTVDLVAELAVAPPAADTAKMEQARRVIGDGNKQLVAKDYGEAVSRYRKAIKVMETAGFALESREFADAWARLGIALHLAGEEDASKDALHTAARMDAAGAVDARQIDRKQGALLDSAREEVAQGSVGAVSVLTTPPGALVYVGGVYRGTSPVTVDRLPAGSNYLRIERPGGVPVVQFVEVREGHDVGAKIKTKFSQEAIDLQKSLTQLPQALGQDQPVPSSIKALGARFRLSRAVVATIETARANQVKLRLVVLDFAKDLRLADETGTFPADPEGGLQGVVAVWARGVLDKADVAARQPNRHAKDPLGRTDGTEGWYVTEAAGEKASDAGGEAKPAYVPKSARKEGVKSKDPLDHSDGTEEW